MIHITRLPGVIVLALVALPPLPQARGQDEEQPLTIYCTADLHGPMQELTASYEKQSREKVLLKLGGDAILVGQLRAAPSGDLVILPQAYLAALEKSGALAEEHIPLAVSTAVLVVAKGNPKKIGTLRDLARKDVRAALPDPRTSSLGRDLFTVLKNDADWAAAKAATKVYYPTVNHGAGGVASGAFDVAVVWQSAVNNNDRVAIVPAPKLKAINEPIMAAVLRTSQQPEQARRFAAFLRSNEAAKAFQSHGLDRPPAN